MVITREGRSFALRFTGRIHLAFCLIVCITECTLAEDVLPVKALQERQLAFNRLRGISTRSHPLYFTGIGRTRLK